MLRDHLQIYFLAQVSEAPSGIMTHKLNDTAVCCLHRDAKLANASPRAVISLSCAWITPCACDPTSDWINRLDPNRIMGADSSVGLRAFTST